MPEPQILTLETVKQAFIAQAELQPRDRTLLPLAITLLLEPLVKLLALQENIIQLKARVHA